METDILKKNKPQKRLLLTLSYPADVEALETIAVLRRACTGKMTVLEDLDQKNVCTITRSY